MKKDSHNKIYYLLYNEHKGVVAFESIIIICIMAVVLYTCMQLLKPVFSNEIEILVNFITNNGQSDLIRSVS